MLNYQRVLIALTLVMILQIILDHPRTVARHAEGKAWPWTYGIQKRRTWPSGHGSGHVHLQAALQMEETSTECGGKMVEWCGMWNVKKKSGEIGVKLTIATKQQCGFSNRLACKFQAMDQHHCSALAQFRLGSQVLVQIQQRSLGAPYIRDGAATLRTCVWINAGFHAVPCWF